MATVVFCFLMSFLVIVGYMKFYGSSPYALMDNKPLYDELVLSYRIAKDELYPEFLSCQDSGI